MDKRQGTPESSLSSPSTTGATSALQTIDEHVDSPMRKRPRLGGASTAAVGLVSSTSPTTPCEVRGTPPQNTPGRRLSSNPHIPSSVTLNLRSADFTAPGAKPNSVADESPGRTPPRRPSLDLEATADAESPSLLRESIDLIAGSSPLPLQSPPVMEIEVDDLEDIGDDTYAGGHRLKPAENQGVRLLLDFPFAHENGVPEAAAMFATSLGGRGE